MSNLTVQRLGEEAQFDNEPHRLDYIRRDQGRLDPALHTPRLGYREIAALGLVFIPGWAVILLFLWLLRGVSTWGASSSDWEGYQWVLHYIWLLWASLPVFCATGFAAVVGWQRVTRTRVETARARITRDRYSNPIDVRAVIGKSLEQNWKELSLATQAEVVMAPYKQLPAGLDSLSNSRTVHAAPHGPAATPGVEEGDNQMPFDEFWRILTEDVVHLKAIGPSKSGKSTLCQALLNHIVSSDCDQVVVLSPVGAADDWSVPVIGLTDIDKIPAALDRLIAEGDRRQGLLASMPRSQFDREYNHIWIFVDETPEVAQNKATKDKWQEFFSRFGSRARHMHMHVVIMAQTETTMSLGTKGNAAIKENLTTVYTKKIAGRHVVEIVHGEDEATREPLTRRVQDVYRLRELALETPALRPDAVFLTEDDLIVQPSDNELLEGMLQSNSYSSAAGSLQRNAEIEPGNTQKNKTRASAVREEVERLAAERNEDGKPKYTQRQIRDMVGADMNIVSSICKQLGR